MRSPFGCLLYVISGLIQIFAIIEGFKAWWGWNDFFAIIGSIFVGYTPILGTIMGIMGAIKGWHWSPLFAFLFFCWPVILYAIPFLFIGLAHLLANNSSDNANH